MILAERECTTLTEMLLSGLRLDGRTLKEFREINFHFPSGHPNGGCCIVKIGSTSVLAKVSVEIVEPKHYRPAQGMLFVNFDATLISAGEGKRKGRTRDDEGRRLSAVLQTCFRDSIDLDALCIVAWERVFAVRVDLRAISFDGNLGDCGALAAIAALASFRRPDVFVGPDGRVIVDHECKHRPTVPLSIRRIPVLVTLGLASDTKVILQDPSKREEAILTGGRVMVGLTAYGELCCLHTSGLNTPIKSNSLSMCILLANSRARSLVALVQRVLDGLELQRKARIAVGSARQSELEKAKQVALDAPLVLSSASFLPGGKNAPLMNTEEGEVVTSDGTDMEISDSEGSDVNQEGTRKIALSENAGHEGIRLDPYGVIEVSSLVQNATHSETTNEIPNLSHFSSMESDITALSHIIHMTAKGRCAFNKAEKSLKSTTIVKHHADLDDEDTTAVLCLK